MCYCELIIILNISIMWFICNFAGILCLFVVYTAIILVNISVVYASYDCQYHLIFFELLVLI